MDIRKRTWTAVVVSAAAALSCGGGGSATCPLTGGGGTAGNYHIGLRYLTTTVTDPEKAAFDAAVARIEEIVTSAPSSVPVTWSADARQVCGDLATTDVPVSETIGGLVIFVSVKDLGAGAILAESGPCLIRSLSHLPLAAVMIFNSQYLDRLPAGDLDKTVLHEMLHTLGFGTMWGPPTAENGFGRDLLSSPGMVGDGFTGKHAVCATKGLDAAPSGWTSVPVEDCTGTPLGDTCGSATGDGTRDVHWRWAVFHDELMTGWIAPGVPQPLSATTLASLQDIGYTVDLSKADPYTIPSTPGVRALESVSPGLWLGDDVRRVPPLEVPEP